MKYILPAALFFFAIACSTRSQREYVKLTIPEELRDHPEVVEKLEEDVEQLNRVFNSIDDYLEDLLSLEDEIREFDTTGSTAVFRAKMSMKMMKIQSSAAKITYNAAWYFGKDILASDTTLLTRLDEGERMQYSKCMDHISVQSDLLQSRLEEIAVRMDSLVILMDEKMPGIEEKLKEEADKATEQENV